MSQRDVLAGTAAGGREGGKEGGGTHRGGKGHRAETSSPRSAGVGGSLWTMSLRWQRPYILEAESGIYARTEVSVLERLL